MNEATILRPEPVGTGPRELEEVRKYDGFKDGPPVIDLAGLEGTERQRIGREIAHACETWGFFQVINHEFDLSLMKAAKEVSKEFFHLPEEEKMKVSIKPGVMEGYNCPQLSGATEGQSRLTSSNVHLLLLYDPMTSSQSEREQWPSNPPNFRTIMIEYIKEAIALQSKVLSVMSEMLGLERDAIEKLFQGPDPNYDTHRTRINYYPPSREADNQVHCYAHSDPGGLTLLLADEVPGLEVKRNNEWVQIKPIADAIIFNVADQIEILSNGRYKSVEHRGMPHPTVERLSIATFYSPYGDAVIGPIAELVDDSHPALYEPSVFQDYLHCFLISWIMKGKSLNTKSSQSQD